MNYLPILPRLLSLALLGISVWLFFWFGKSDPEVQILSIIQVLMRDSKITMNVSGVVLMVEKRSMNKVNDAVPYPSSYWEISVQ